MRSDINTRGKYPISRIAKWFLAKGDMTHRKLQKLCYYAEAWSIALNNAKLLTDTKFEGWVHGPVSPELYQQYKRYGWVTIPAEAHAPSLDEGTIELLTSVYDLYGDFTGLELSDFTHNEKPWINSRNGLHPMQAGNKPIDLYEMKDFYSSLLADVDEEQLMV